MSTHTQLTRADDARAELASTGQNAPAGKPASGPRAVAEPAVEIFEDAGGITLLADMPGVPREALDVRLDGETLVIEGEAAVSAPDGMRPLWAEVSVPRFRRAAEIFDRSCSPLCQRRHSDVDRLTHPNSKNGGSR